MIFHINDYIQSCNSENMVKSICTVLSEMKDGDTLCLDGQTMHLYPEGAYTAFYAISNNESGEKSIAFPLIKRKDITIDGQSEDGVCARLIFHTRILPFVVDECDSITIRNIIIDYSSSYHAQPKIIEAEDDRTVLQFDSSECGCKVKNGHFCFYSRTDGWEQESEAPLALEFSPELDEGIPLQRATNAKAVPSAYKPSYFPYCGEVKDHGFLGKMFKEVTLRELAPDIIEMTGKLGFTHTTGSYLVMTHSGREFPGILLYNSKCITLENIYLAYTRGMGIIAQNSENLFLDRIIARVEEGSDRLLSVNADATHFVNCRGIIQMRDCIFTNMMDDACNIHGIYGIIAKQDGNILSIVFGHSQQEGVNFFRSGDKVAIIDRNEVETICTLTVSKSELVSLKELRVTVETDLPRKIDGADFTTGNYLIENLSTAPNVIIKNCESGYNRPRGFLVSTAGKTIIENCTFYNMYTGIQLGGEMLDWYESGAVNDITVKNCNFENSAYAGGISVVIKSRVVKIPSTPLHGFIRFENNRFVQSAPRIMHALSVKKICFSENEFVENEKLPKHPAYGDNGIIIDACEEVHCFKVF